MMGGRPPVLPGPPSGDSCTAIDRWQPTALSPFQQGHQSDGGIDSFPGRCSKASCSLRETGSCRRRPTQRPCLLASASPRPLATCWLCGATSASESSATSWCPWRTRRGLEPPSSRSASAQPTLLAQLPAFADHLSHTLTHAEHNFLRWDL